MPERKSNKDVNEIASRIRHETEDDADPGYEPSSASEAAKILGRLGGLRGGPARAKKLSKKRRSQIARDAARARWAEEKKKQK